VSVLSNAASAVSLTDGGLPYFSRVAPSDDHKIDYMAFLIRKYGWRRVAILTDAGTYASELAAAFRIEAAKLKVRQCVLASCHKCFAQCNHAITHSLTLSLTLSHTSV
jgi:ABC-type branched-subunit amino acid transport system substrate-binding protein